MTAPSVSRLYGIVALTLVSVITLVGCGSPQPTTTSNDGVGREHITPAAPPPDSTPDFDVAANAVEVVGLPTVVPAIIYDPDGDGFIDTPTLVQAVTDTWQGYSFPPGYQFAIERFLAEFEDRAGRNDERWQLRYNDTILSMSQTCAWIDYWFDVYPTQDQDAIQAAERMFTTVFPKNFVFADMQNTMVDLGNAVLLGDVGSVQQMFTMLNCSTAYYRPDWEGPIVAPTPTAGTTSGYAGRSRNAYRS